VEIKCDPLNPNQIASIGMKYISSLQTIVSRPFFHTTHMRHATRTRVQHIRTTHMRHATRIRVQHTRCIEPVSRSWHRANSRCCFSMTILSPSMHLCQAVLNIACQESSCLQCPVTSYLSRFVDHARTCQLISSSHTSFLTHLCKGLSVHSRLLASSAAFATRLSRSSIGAGAHTEHEQRRHGPQTHAAATHACQFTDSMLQSRT
jgi:hypothetical protein